MPWALSATVGSVGGRLARRPLPHLARSVLIFRAFAEVLQPLLDPLDTALHAMPDVPGARGRGDTRCTGPWTRVGAAVVTGPACVPARLRRSWMSEGNLGERVVERDEHERSEEVRGHGVRVRFASSSVLDQVSNSG